MRAHTPAVQALQDREVRIETWRDGEKEVQRDTETETWRERKQDANRETPGCEKRTRSAAPGAPAPPSCPTGVPPGRSSQVSLSLC